MSLSQLLDIWQARRAQSRHERLKRRRALPWQKKHRLEPLEPRLLLSADIMPSPLEVDMSAIGQELTLRFIEQEGTARVQVVEPHIVSDASPPTSPRSSRPASTTRQRASPNSLVAPLSVEIHAHPNTHACSKPRWLPA